MNNYGELYNQVKTFINSLEVERVFYLRECIDNPPIMLGRWLREDVDAKRLLGVIFHGKDAYGTNKYKKIE